MDRIINLPTLVETIQLIVHHQFQLLVGAGLTQRLHWLELCHQCALTHHAMHICIQKSEVHAQQNYGRMCATNRRIT